MAPTIEATWSSPCRRSPATASDLVSPSGNRPPTSPAKTRSVASPSTRGPTDIAATLSTVSSSTAYALTRSGAIRRSSRIADGPKSVAFWPTIPPPIGPRPGPAGPACTRSVSFSWVLMRPPR